MSNPSNHVQLIGHLGKDVETIELGNGKKLAKVTLATNHSYRTGDNEWTEQTDWHQLVGWGKMADRLQKVATKGTQMCVTGRLNYHSYEDKQGNKRYTTQIVVDSVRTFKKTEKQPF